MPRRLCSGDGGALAQASYVEELQARASFDRLEIVDGEIVEKAAPSPNHSIAEGKVTVAVDGFNRRPGNRGPGGWWSFPEIHVSYPRAGELYCHDVAGWRRDRLPERLTDLVDKPRTLHAAQVPHYWVLDPEERILLVHRWSPDGYVVVQRAKAGERIRAEPFDAIEIEVAVLFGDEETD
jgi:Uma2 family endonuclease